MKKKHTTWRISTQSAITSEMTSATEQQKTYSVIEFTYLDGRDMHQLVFIQKEGNIRAINKFKKILKNKDTDDAIKFFNGKTFDDATLNTYMEFKNTFPSGSYDTDIIVKITGKFTCPNDDPNQDLVTWFETHLDYCKNPAWDNIGEHIEMTHG